MKRAPWILASLLLAGTAHAQTDQAQLVRPQGSADLNSHLARLAANPRDSAALIGAGEAALALDDPRAAAGFFARADAIESGNGRIKAGLARVMLKLNNPVEALRLFDQAGRLGYPDTTILSDRALARDMTGDQAGAQRDYQAALKASPDDDELRRRYAASLGISGQVEASDKVLQPLLYKSDRAAWRYRAFILAMNNKQTEAKGIAEQTMPGPLAAAILPYMQKMPYLTAAQKAAAIHFGQFPQQIGTSIAAITPTPPAPGFAPSAPAASSTAPSGTQLASAEQARARGSSRDRLTQPIERSRDRRRSTRLAQAQTQPPVPAAEGRAPAPLPAPAPAPTSVPAPVPAAPSASAPVPSRVAATPPQGPKPASQAVQGPPSPGFESMESRPATPPAAAPAAGSQINAIALARADAATPPPAPAEPASMQPAPSASDSAPPPMVQPVVPVAPTPNPEATRTLADIIRAIDVPEAERQASVAAVDLNEIAQMQAARRAERQAAADKVKKAAAAKAKAEADAKAKAEAEEKKRLADNPSRNWLQVGVGQNKSALGFTMKGLRKKYDSLAPQDAWSASWSRTNRLLVGPFSSFTRAKELEAKLKAAGADVFAWKSSAGEVVEKLPGQ